MVTLLNKQSLFSIFKTQSFETLDDAINNMAPSMVEYYLSDLHMSNDHETYFNKRNIEKTINVGNYTLYYAYDENVYLEVDDSILQDNDTGSFW